MAHFALKAGQTAVVAAFVGVCFITSAFAASTTYSDRALFAATLDQSVTDHYDNPAYIAPPPTASKNFSDSDMSNVIGETVYTTTGLQRRDGNKPVNTVMNFGLYGLPNMESGAYCADLECNSSFLLDFTNTSVGDASGVFGVGFNFINAPQVPYSAFVTFGDGSTENYGLPASQDFGPASFFGITNADSISSIAFGLPGGLPTQTWTGFFAIDNLTVGNAPLSAVPLPAAFPLYGAGLAMVGFLGWRKRRKA